ncbi:hypothetical protein [Aneurinibacillus migulanus]|nr:hypothetical protein [Aneurinibacillus migulanus]
MENKAEDSRLVVSPFYFRGCSKSLGNKSANFYVALPGSIAP